MLHDSGLLYRTLEKCPTYDFGTILIRVAKLFFTLVIQRTRAQNEHRFCLRHTYQF